MPARPFAHVPMPPAPTPERPWAASAEEPSHGRHAALPVPARPPLAAGLVAGLAGAKLVLHLVTSAVTPYGIHRDELLYLGMGAHLQFWRMDFPPAIAVLANAARFVFGDTLFAVRFFPAVAGALLVVLAALLARELGGGRAAQGLAALAVLTSPLFLRAAALFQPVVLDQLWWTLGLYALVRLVRTDDPRAWLLFGLACGLGLLTKVSIVFFGLSVALALVLTPRRAWLRTRGPWLAVGLTLVVGSATLAGQVRLGWPVFPQMAALQADQLHRVTPAQFVLEQLLFGPATLLAAGGLVALLAGRRLRAFRVVGVAALAAFALLLVLQGKAYYFGPMYPALYAAGAVWLEHAAGRRAAAVRGAVAALLVLFGLAILPLGLPLLPPPALARYTAALGLSEAANRSNQGGQERIPQDYADMLGWEEMVRAVAAVYHRLPPAQRREAVLLAGNYGEAGALDFYGPRHGLPRVVSPHTSYWFFGPGEKPGTVLLTVGVPRQALEAYYGDVTEAGRHTHPWAVSEERDLPLYVATRPRQTLQAVWPSLAGRY